ncbi:4Fe-4S dicluster domain-containing protein [Sulfidibacter corallicola]|uniref:4Fe-4S dicluster domain-containing protein n=1 Tax=Sulfidibacter corallicola TaxID=2818388 RepID=A0A8A4TFK8_SULCO|nr:4Fe-4S dicluster domain-containing protein [Sulfidibacter corallicola]QTD47531.1 4Fe-4S dicluster domain-containing protein [Sulfidibacter corallicola]
MASQDPHNRRGFLGEFFSVFRKGISNQVDRKLGKMLDAPIRPPGALEEIEFLATCTRCSACIEVCPYSAIKRQPIESGLSANAPFIQPDEQACRLCDDFPCIGACEPGALRPLPDGRVDMGHAVVRESFCQTYEDKVCTLCYDACPYPEQAIVIGDDFHPQVLEACVGCGLCEQHCPVHPSGIKVESPVRLRAKKVERETYFGWFDAREDASPPKEK